MNTSKEYYQPVLEALCAFIRDRTAETSEGAIGSDIYAALKVIGRRAPLGEAIPDLRNVRLPKADLSNVKLVGADLSDARLTQAQLDQACGTEVGGLDQHDPPLTMIKPCPQPTK
jgi:Pentapeptide repeats (8 copies)